MQCAVRTVYCKTVICAKLDLESLGYHVQVVRGAASAQTDIYPFEVDYLTPPPDQANK